MQQTSIRALHGTATSGAGMVLLALVAAITGRPDAMADTTVDLRAYFVDAHGVPPQLNRGTEHSREEPDFVPSIALGHALTPQVALELRYISIGDFTARSETVAPVIEYEHRLESEVVAVGLPLTWAATDALSFTVTPSVHLEFQDRELRASTTDPTLNIIPRVTRPREAWGPGVSAGAAFRINQKIELTADAAHLGLDGYEALLLGGGLRIRF